MGNIACSSSSRRLQDCTFDRNPSGCTHDDDAGVDCSSCSLYLCDNGQCVTGALCNGIMDCTDGSDENNIICCEFENPQGGSRNCIIILMSFFSCSYCAWALHRHQDSYSCGCYHLGPAYRCPGGHLCLCVSVHWCLHCKGPRNVVSTSYNPAPNKMQPVV